jgi:hypothetical protein
VQHRNKIKMSREHHAVTYTRVFSIFGRTFTSSSYFLPIPKSIMISTAAAFVQRNPILFNAATSLALCTGADIVAQQMEGPTKKWDLKRLVVAGVIGMLFGGFIYPSAYTMLDAKWVGKDFVSVFTKSVIDCATVGLLGNAVTMTCHGFSSGRQRLAVLQHVIREMPRVTLHDAYVWLPYNMLAFTIIPPLIRPATTSLVEASWQTYISMRSNDYASRAATAVANHGVVSQPIGVTKRSSLKRTGSKRLARHSL